MTALRSLGIAVLLLACGTGRETASRRAEPPDQQPAPDSLVLTAPDGTQIWFTLQRPVTTPDGATCVDRAIEVRRNRTRISVPLLYTGTAPELVNDSTIRARLSTGCRPGDAYLVNLRHGHPTREHR